MKHPNHKRGNLPSGSSIINSSKELPQQSLDELLPKSSTGADIFQQGYMIKRKPRPIIELIREYQDDS